MLTVGDSSYIVIKGRVLIGTQSGLAIPESGLCLERDLTLLVRLLWVEPHLCSLHLLMLLLLSFELSIWLRDLGWKRTRAWKRRFLSVMVDTFLLLWLLFVDLRWLRGYVDHFVIAIVVFILDRLFLKNHDFFTWLAFRHDWMRLRRLREIVYRSLHIVHKSPLFNGLKSLFELSLLFFNAVDDLFAQVGLVFFSILLNCDLSCRLAAVADSPLFETWGPLTFAFDAKEAPISNLDILNLLWLH